MSQFFVDRSAVPGGEVLTTSAQDGAHFPPDATGNVDFSGAAAGAITFGQIANGAVTATVNVDGTSIIINGSNQLESVGGGTTWVMQGTSTTGVNGFGYYCYSTLTITCPAIATVGTTFKVANVVGLPVVVASNAGQTIQYGDLLANNLTSTADGDALVFQAFIIPPSSVVIWLAWPVTGNWVIT